MSVSDQSTKTAESTGTAETDDTLFKSTVSDDDHLSNVYAINEPEPEQISDVEENESHYLATNETNQMGVLLVVSNQSIREKNELTVRTINKWSMNMLESCEHISTDVVRINFDTIKKDKRSRVYRLEKDHGRKLDEFLRSILSQRISDQMIVLKCANCSLQFSQEKLQRKSGKRTVPILRSINIMIDSPCRMPFC